MRLIPNLLFWLWKSNFNYIFYIIILPLGLVYLSFIIPQIDRSNENESQVLNAIRVKGRPKTEINLIENCSDYGWFVEMENYNP
jgi:hypothetical protein